MISDQRCNVVGTPQRFGPGSLLQGRFYSPILYRSCVISIIVCQGFPYSYQNSITVDNRKQSGLGLELCMSKTNSILGPKGAEIYIKADNKHVLCFHQNGVFEFFKFEEFFKFWIWRYYCKLVTKLKPTFNWHNQNFFKGFNLK